MKRIAPLFRTATLLLLAAAAACTKAPVDDTQPNSKPATTPSTSESADADIDRWMFDYLQTHYLWNQAVKQVTPDYSLDYEDFLDDVLTRVAAQNDINHDDGHWENGQRQYFYSYIARYAKSATGQATRGGTRETISGYGFEELFYYWFDEKQTRLLVVPGAVHPDGPAAKAGLQRGDYIVRVDGANITALNLNAVATKLYNEESGTVKLTTIDYNTGQERDVQLTAATYKDNPILLHKIIPLADGRKAGYLFYNTFNYYYDEELIQTFAEFRSEGIAELILDLRYNSGGHVVSSVVLQTLIAGETHQGEVLATSTYNDDRKNETTPVYRVGEPMLSNRLGDRYAPIGDALTAALGLERVFVLTTGSTASASEMVINGLRGIDLPVHLIGERTNGKNVGMEPITKDFGNYEYDFSPITFYISNGRGDRDYSEGFPADVAATDYLWYQEVQNGPIYPILPGDEQHDTLIGAALEWIETGKQPDSERWTRSSAPQRPLQRIPVAHRSRPQYMMP